MTSDHDPQDRRSHEINRIGLRPLLARDFATSEAFVAQLGKSVTAKGMFIPMRVNDKFQVGQELEVRFTLQGRKEIIAGTVQIVFIRDGANGETSGCGVRYVELSERSVKNLDMIQAWRSERP